MKDNVRRALIFLVTIGAGSLFIFVDLPLILIIPLIAALAVILLILIGSIKLQEITQPLRSAFAKIRSGKGKKPVKPGAKEAPKPKPAPGEKRRISLSFAPVIEKLKTIRFSKASLPTKGNKDAKIKEIDKKLDNALSSAKKTETEREISAQEPGISAGSLPAAASKPKEPADEDDPFLSLTGEDFDSGLLDDLEEDEDDAGLPVNPVAHSGPGKNSVPSEAAEVPASPLPDLHGDAGDLGGVDAIDSELSSLDDIDLDAMDLDDEDDQVPAPPKSSVKPPKIDSIPATPPTLKEPGKKEANIGFDNAMMQDMAPEQIDVAAMAGPAGSDDEMLSLLAAEAKTARKKDDDSLLRDLKDFKAPATEIESELKDIMKKLGGEKTGKKDTNKTSIIQDEVPGKK